MTRSRMASKILSETSPETKEKVKKYSAEVMRRKDEIEAIEFSEEETAEIIRKAILAAKITRWNEQQNKEYFERLEKEKGNL